MPRSLALLVVGLFFGGGLGFFLAAANNIALDGHHHPPDGGGPAAEAAAAGGAATGGHARHGGAVALPAGADAPTLSIRLMRDSEAGWNLHIATTGFRFAPERAGLPHRAGEGHAHVYIDGRKAARVYAPWFHIGALPRRGAAVAVTLNANDHRVLTVAGRPLRAETVAAE